MGKLNLEVLTPEKTALERKVDAVNLQGALGRLGILPGHAMLISKLDFGVMEITHGYETKALLCGGGLLEVNQDRVTVLVRSAEQHADIDADRAKQALDRAKQRRDSKEDDIDMIRAEAALLRSIERLRFIGEM